MHTMNKRIKTILRKNGVKTTTDSYAQLSNSASRKPHRCFCAPGMFRTSPWTSLRARTLTACSAAPRHQRPRVPSACFLACLMGLFYQDGPCGLAEV